MSDFGFDAYALDDLDTSGQPDPLEIAHDLIAGGKLRAALDLLADHHDRLGDDPEYLLLCSSAWWACGDVLRAQQALQGAARLAPDDPRPLQGLGEILAERGERDKAEQLLSKARALELRASEAEVPVDETISETEEDLIAFAERRERTAQAALTPRQVLLGIALVVLLAFLIAGIVFLTSPSEDAAPAGPDAFNDPQTVELAAKTIGGLAAETPPLEEVQAGELQAEELQAEEVQAEEVQAEPSEVAFAQPSVAAEVQAPAPAKKPTRKPAVAKRAPKSAPAVSPDATRSSKSDSTTPAPEPPSDSVVQAELESMSPSELTLRADKLYAQGHSGLAANYYRRALDIDPDYAPALVGIGRSILRAKKYSEAMKNATRALQLARGVDARPGLEAVAIYQMGRVHYEQGERDAARRLFRQAISLPGVPPEAWFYLGEALSSDNSPAARQAYEKYLERVPTGHLADRARRAIQ